MYMFSWVREWNFLPTGYSSSYHNSLIRFSFLRTDFKAWECGRNGGKLWSVFLQILILRVPVNYLQNILQSFTFMWPCILTNFFIIKPTDALISQIYSGTKLCMFQAVPLPIIRSYPLYMRHWHMLYMFEDSLRARKLSSNMSALTLFCGTFHYSRNMWASVCVCVCVCVCEVSIKL